MHSNGVLSDYYFYSLEYTILQSVNQLVLVPYLLYNLFKLLLSENYDYITNRLDIMLSIEVKVNYLYNTISSLLYYSFKSTLALLFSMLYS